jgi:protein SCO1/2
VNENRVFLFAAALVVAAGVGGGMLASRLSRPSAKPQSPVAEPLALPRPLVDFQLTNTAGQIVKRDDLRGRFSVVNFVFTSCSLRCLAVNDRMAEIQRATAGEPDVRLLSFTVDPRSDTPDALAAFGQRFHADPDRWQLLTGDKPSLYRLIEQSFIPKSAALESFIPGGFAQTDRIMLVDPQGSVCASFDGLSTNVASLVLAEIQKRRPAKSYNTRGLVRSIADDRHTALIRHETIPGYMPAMTMELNIRDTNELTGIIAGDNITFRLTATDETHWVDQIQKVGSTPLTNAAVSAPKIDVVHELNPGDLMPDASFQDENGNAIRIADFRGRALAFTFFFTRCPLPDFCPLMNKHFERARSALSTDTNAPANWMLLSISFDSEFDKPAVLAGYANGYRGGDNNRWLFAAASQATLAELAPRLDLRVERDGSGFSHNLRTVVLDTQGRIHKQFDGNTWKANELVKAIRDAAAVTPDANTNR